jgi:tetratricopeptide (TPR) repeat protein
VALGLAQPISHVPVSDACIELNDAVLVQAANGQIEKVESAVSRALATGATHLDPSCAAVVLSNVAAAAASLGQLVEAERWAGQSISILEKSYPPNHPAFFHPLQVLVSVWFEQGKTTTAKKMFKRLQSLRIERAEDVAVIHEIAAEFLEAEGKYREAESEYFASIDAWKQTGRGDSVQAGSLLNSLGLLYIKAHRLEDARRTIYRALDTFSADPNALPMERIKVHSLLGFLHSRKKEWPEAVEEFGTALSIADREPWLHPSLLRLVLSSYAEVLRKSHHRQEARSIETRMAALPRDRTTEFVVDVNELLEAKPAKK